MNRTGLKYQPQVFENGWYCACGAFHPKEEDTVYCSECGSDRILLQNALNTLLQPQEPEEAQELDTPLNAPAEPAEAATRILGAAPQPGEEPTRILGSRGYAPAAQPAAGEEHTRVMGAAALRDPAQGPDDGTRVIPAVSDADFPAAASPVQEAAPDDEEDSEDERDSVAETLIRWVPPITAIVCAGVALCGFIYYQFML